MSCPAWTRGDAPPTWSPPSRARCCCLNSTQHKSFYKLENLFWSNEFHSKFYKSFIRRNNSSYQKALKELYRAIALHTQEGIIIESSKYPSRALNLSNYLDEDEFEIKYIYLKKDPVKVVKSFNKKDIEQPSKSFLNANFYYLLVNILCHFTVKKLERRGHKVYVIKNETFLKDPESVLNQASQSLSLDFSRSIEKILNKKPLDTGFLFDGNRIRLKETLFLQPYKNNTDRNLKYYFTRIFNYIVYR